MADTNSTNRKKTLSPPESTRRKQTKGIPAKKTIPKSTVKKKVKSKALPQKKSKSHDSSTSPTVKKKTTVKKKSTTKTVPVSPAQTSAKKRPPVSKKKSASPLPQEKSPSSSRPKGKRLRKTPTGTISQIYYRQLRERSKRTKLIQTIILLSVGCAAAIVILWYAQHRVQKSNLLKLSTHGFIALEEDQLEEAETIFSRVVSMYKSYHTKHPDWWFKQDAFVFTTLLRIAQCWRSLGDYESAFDTYRSVSLHNVEGHESWVGLQLE